MTCKPAGPGSWRQAKSVLLLCRHAVQWMQQREATGCTVVLLAMGSLWLGAFAVADPLKEDAPAVVAALKARGLQVCALSSCAACCMVYAAPCLLQGKHVSPQGHIRPRQTNRGTAAGCIGALLSWLTAELVQVWMVTGDNKTTAHIIAAKLGITNVMAEVLPAGKAEQVRACAQSAAGADPP